MGSRKATVLRILATAYIWNDVSSFFLSPHERALVPSLSRRQEYYCRQQADGHYQCWQLNKLSWQHGSETRLYEGATETDSSSAISDSRKRLIARMASTSQSPTDNSGVNGSNVNGSLNGSALNGSNANGSIGVYAQKIANVPPLIDLDDVPQPTENGGFSHTASSRAKISAANKGKTPWNKGKHRSEEVKARIAAGVRARNRERFLQKLKDQGITEEQYNGQKKAERAKKDAERRARRTAKGGYRPTEETRAKISKILKEKHAKGEIKPRKVDPNKVRKGFTHSEETRAKISASLRERWANDPEYREKMRQQTIKSSTSEETRQRISETLKKKWQDPEFRAEMMEKMSSSGGGGSNKGLKHNAEHKRKISEAMKKRWQDDEYRGKLLDSIAKRKPPPKRMGSANGATKGSVKKREKIVVVQPMQPSEGPPKKRKRARKQKIVFAQSEEHAVQLRQAKPIEQNTEPAAKKERKKKEPDGSVNRLREESRELFDLLYGDEDGFDNDDEDEEPVQRKPAFFEFGDEDLDSFDPYGLEDY